VISESTRYATTGAVPELSADDVLPCHVTEVQGYNKSRRLPAEHIVVSKADVK
jgi:hypothetical protein